MDQATDSLNEEVSASGTSEVEEKLPEDIDQLRAEIEATRIELTHTIDAIQDKIDPRKVAARAGDQALEKARETSEKVAETAKSVTHTLSEKVGEKAPGVAKTIRAKGAKIAGKIRRHPRALAIAGGVVGAVLMAVGVGRSRR